MLPAMEPRHRIPPLGDAGRRLAERLPPLLAGEVHVSPLRRWLYSTDASGYRVVPEVVVVARAPDDLAAVATLAAEEGVPVTVRGAGTSVAGQAIGPGVVVDCFQLDRVIAIDPDARRARVQPGVIQASLNRAAAPFGLEFGPDTSTVDEATLGGMVGNNSSGSRSIVYGETRDKVVAVRGVLAGGTPVELRDCRAGDLRSGLGGPAADRLAAALAALRERRREALAACSFDARRCTTGYDVRELLAPAPRLARLAAGSEGTLLLFTELEVALDPRPRARLGAALTFATLRRALEANVAILATGPSAVELLDLGPLRAAPNLRAYATVAPLLGGDEEAMLTVEYQGTEDEAHDGLRRLRALVGDLGAVQVAWLEEPAAAGEAAALRRAALPLLMGAPGAARPASFVEDTAVAPERLADFVADFQRLVAAHGARASFTGHASAGCLHVRPLLDLKTASGVATMDALAREVADLVARYHGVISGEHGCGRSRSWALPHVLPAGVYEAMAELKQAFDPDGLLAPGIVVDGPPVTADLRFGADYRGREPWRPRLSFAAEGGFLAAVERCFGAGWCKKQTGTMCPPAAVTGDEARATRARANALQALACGAVPLAAVDEDEFVAVLGTCVACKACASECPAGVDMAALKAEWLAERRARRGTPPLHAAVARFRRLATFAAPLAPLLGRLAATAPARAVAARLGVALERPLPRLAHRPLSARLRGRRVVRGRGDVRVAVFLDCFTQFQEPAAGEALARLLDAAGVPFVLVDAGCCGRTALSTGHVELAREQAAHALAVLDPLAAEGCDLLFVEPTCLAMVLDDWRRLLPGDARLARVAGRARPALALVADLAAAGRLRFRGGGAALLHSHCHEKAVGFAAATERALRSVPGLALEVLDAGCCGMAGVFGYEAEHYALSVAMAERVLMPAVRAAAPGVAVLATGTSCRTQVRDLGAAAQHPLEFLAARLDGGAA